MRRVFLLIVIVSVFLSCGRPLGLNNDLVKTRSIRMAQPIAEIDSVFFISSAMIKLEMNHEGSDINYTIESSDASSEWNSYTEAIEIVESGMIKYSASHPDFIDSVIDSIEVIKINALNKSTKVTLNTEAHPSYPGMGTSSLIDINKASLNFKDEHWLGFKTDTLTIDLKLDRPKEISAVGISALSDQGSWIFLPHSVQLIIDGEILQSQFLSYPDSKMDPHFKYIILPIETQIAEDISLRIIHHSKIPDWHSGRGEKPWLFIDEVFLN